MDDYRNWRFHIKERNGIKDMYLDNHRVDSYTTGTSFGQLYLWSECGGPFTRYTEYDVYLVRNGLKWLFYLARKRNQITPLGRLSKELHMLIFHYLNVKNTSLY